MQTYTVEIDSYGNERWYKPGTKTLHRDGDKPAAVYADGSQFWYQNGKCHRDGDKPAVVDADGTQFWYQNGQLHRDGDKPAEVYANGSQFWYEHSIEISKAEIDRRAKARQAAEEAASCAGKVVEIDGKRYTLVEI